jgi:membrane protein
VSLPIALDRLPPWAQRLIAWLETRWLGRIVLRTTRSSVRIELFDRSMTIAAQLFTSVFPILILLGSWFGGTTVADSTTHSMPDPTKELIYDAIGANSTTKVSFGFIGALIVLASATSLSRALTRAFAAIWELPRPKSKLVFAWRWVAVVFALALSLVATRSLLNFAEKLEPQPFWAVVFSMGVSVGVMVFVPWCLLEGVIRPRALLPGALIYGLVLLIAQPAVSVFFAKSLASSAARYGPIGVAFTFIAWLYAAAFALLTASILGEAIATDPGWFGRWLMKPRKTAATPPAEDAVATEVTEPLSVGDPDPVADEQGVSAEPNGPPDPASGVSAARTP